MNVSMTSPILLMMRDRENPCELLITPEMAKEICTNWMYEQQRPLYKRNVDHYRTSMNANEWKRGSTLTFTSQGFCVNGQHRLRALSDADVACWFIVYVSNDPDEDLYVVQDCGRSRSAADTLPSDTKNKTIVAGTIRLILNCQKNGLNSGKFFTDKPQPYEPRRYYDLHKAEINDVSAAAAFTRGRYTYCSPKTLAFVYWLTQHIDPDLAKVFRDGVSGTGDANWMYVTLSNWIIGKSNSGTKIKEYVYIRALASLWNALVEGRTLAKLCVSQTKPIVFKGMESAQLD